MNRLTFVAIACVLAAVLVQHAQSCCDKDCPHEDKCSCEGHSGECKDKSEHCEKFKPHCENFFFRKCIRCACMKTCGVCKVKESSSSSSSSTEEDLATDPPTTAPTTPEPTATPQRTTNSTTEASTATEAPTTTEASTPTEEPTTTRFEALAMAVQLTTTEEPEPTGSTVDPFKDDGKVKCMSCKKRRKELKALYNKYYPKDQQDQEQWDEASTTPQPTHATEKKRN